MRQRSTGRQTKAQRDSLRQFRNILTHAQNGDITAHDWMALYEGSERNRRNPQFLFDTDSISPTPLDIYRLCARKEDRDELNLAALKDHHERSNEPIVCIDAITTGSLKAKEADADSFGGLERKLWLAKGARVMCSWNGWQEGGIVNGAIGTVYDILYKDGEGPPHHNKMPAAILVQFPDGGIYKGPSFLDDVPRVVKFSAHSVEFVVDGRTEKRTQFPLHLAYALTIHKSQGLTLDRCSINLGKSEFDVGLTYTSMSRCRRAEHMYFEPMPTIDRLSSWQGLPSLKDRLREEAIIEIKFNDTIHRQWKAFKISEAPGRVPNGTIWRVGLAALDSK